jgi:hypothetical protein
MGQTSFSATNNRNRPVIRVVGERLGVIGAHQLAQTACFGTKNVSSKRTRPGDLKSPGSYCKLAPREAVSGL